MDAAAQDHDGVNLADPVRLGQPLGHEVEDNGQREADGEGGQHGSVLCSSAEDLAGAEAAKEDGRREVCIDAGAGEFVCLVAVDISLASCAATPRSCLAANGFADVATYLVLTLHKDQEYS